MSTAIFIFEQNRDVTTLDIRGYLSESSQFPDFHEGSAQLLLINCEHLQGLNSVAVANWILWIGEIVRHTEIRIQFCPRQLITAFSTVPKMLPENVTVESFYVPYYCGNCSVDTHLFFKTVNLIYDAEMKKPLEVPDTADCKSCKKPATIDVIEQLYFGFLKK